MKKQMLINVLQPEEIRIAILEDGVLEELYVERTSHESYVGNIYKGRIVNIEPSIQAAFVDFGVGRNGFLHVSDVEPAYYRHMDGYGEERGSRGSPRDRHRGGRDRDRPRRPKEDDFDDLMEPERDTEPHEVLEAPLMLDNQFEQVEVFEEDIAGDVMDRSWPEDAQQPVVDQEPWEKSELAIEAAEEALETELPEPQQRMEEIHAPAALEHEVVEAEEDNGEATEVEPAEETVASEESPTEATEEKPKRGRRTRGGRGRGRRAGKGKTKAKDDAPESDAPPADDGPRLMDSAEHRTGPDDRPSSPDLSDDELSFSRRPRSEPKPAPKPETPPEPEWRPETVRDFQPLQENVVERPAPWEPPTEIIQSIDDLAQSVRDDIPSDAAIDVAMESDISIDEDNDVESVDIQEIKTVTREREDAFEPEIETEQPSPRPEEREYDRGRDRGGRNDRNERGGRGRNERGDRGDRGGRDRGDRGGRDRGDRGGRDRGRSGDRRPSGGSGGRPGFGRPKPLIQDIFRRGQEVLVQVIKEGLGTKGPTLSTYISIAGRYLVLMPGLNRIGVSRKIDDDNARRRLRDVMNELNPPKGLGFIIRTAGQDRDKKELQRDLMYLARLWKVVARRIRKQKGPCEVYQESDMVTRTIRDIFSSEIDAIWVDEKNAYESAKEFLDVVMPKYADRIKLWENSEPMFFKHGIEQEIGRIQQRRVELPMGGSIVIDQTEALVAIDVNSGNFRADNNAEETAFKMNLQAAKEIARQLRLRDLGGVIVNDFIDMREERHRRGVERALHDAMRRDRARTKLLHMSQFGIIEMTRQRIRPSLKRSVFHECTHCKGTGQVKTVESMSIEVMRLVQLAAHRESISRLEVRVQDEVASYLLNRKRADLARVEEASGKNILIRGVLAAAPEFLEFLCYDNNSHEVKFSPFEEPQRPPQRRGGYRDR
jgi:ribonuclease E